MKPIPLAASGKVGLGLGGTPREEWEAAPQGTPSPFASSSGTPADLREGRNVLSQRPASEASRSLPKKARSESRDARKLPLTVEDGGRRLRASLENLQLLTCPWDPVRSHCPGASREAPSKLFHAWLRLGKGRFSFAERASSGSAELCLLPRGVALPPPEKLLEKASGGEEGEPSRRAPVRFLPPALAAVPALGAFACFESPKRPPAEFLGGGLRIQKNWLSASPERVLGEPNGRLVLHQE